MVKCITWIVIFLCVFTGKQLLESYHAHRWMDAWQVELAEVHSQQLEESDVRELSVDAQEPTPPKVRRAELPKTNDRPSSRKKKIIHAAVDHGKEVATEVEATNISFTKPKKKKSYRKRTPVNINLADSSTLTTVKGIGPVLSTRIVKYRKRLGGFYHVDQLKEVYGIKAEYWEAIKAQISSSGPVQQLDACGMSFKTLLRHPYLEYEDVKKIKRLCDRKQWTLGSEKVDNLLSELGDRIRPYFSTKPTTTSNAKSQEQISVAAK